METVTKRDLVTKLSNTTGLNQADVLNVLENLLDTVTGELAKGNTVVMRNNPQSDKTVGAYVQEVKENVLNAFNHQEYPFQLVPFSA